MWWVQVRAQQDGKHHCRSKYEGDGLELSGYNIQYSWPVFSLCYLQGWTVPPYSGNAHLPIELKTPNVSPPPLLTVVKINDKTIPDRQLQ